METSSLWKKCSSCKKPIHFGQVYWVCSVSTCNRVRTGLVFCSISCFDAHVPMMNHRDSGAFERQAPSAKEWAAQQQPQTGNQSVPPLLSPKTGSSSPTMHLTTSPAHEDEILVVVSKVKEYIKQRGVQRGHGAMNTSDRVMELLSDRIRVWARDGIRHAEAAGRKTVLDRDL